jgi:glycosyltransferase involved in cell wall biosynthesis
MNNRFVFLMPAYNAEKTIAQSLMSVIAQSYSNWKIIIKDDMSTDSTTQIIENFTKVFGLQEKIDLHVNNEKKWEVKNVSEMIQLCDPTDIICRLDGDDWLTDLDILYILNQRYNQTQSRAIWTAHRWSFTDSNISGPLPKDANPYEHHWVSSHLKTCKADLVQGINEENYKNKNGEYFKRIGDQAMYLPALWNAKGNWHFEPRVAYHYTIKMEPETFSSDDAKFQKSEAEYLRSRGFI